MSAEPLSEARLAEIRKAQPGDWLSGPWTILENSGTDTVPGTWQVIHHDSGTVLATLPDWAGNLALWIADAHDTVPELLAEADRLNDEARAFADRINELESRVCDCEPVREHCDLRRPALYQHTATCPVTEMTA